jgi:hypothetical protein
MSGCPRRSFGARRWDDRLRQTALKASPEAQSVRDLLRAEMASEGVEHDEAVLAIGRPGLSGSREGRLCSPATY